MSEISFTLPRFIPVQIAVGKPAKGEKIQYETGAADISAWSPGQLAQWLAAGLANIGGDRLAGAKNASDATGETLISFKRQLARDFLASLAGAQSFPGRKLAEKGKAPAKRIPSLATCREILASSISPDDLGMEDGPAFAAWLDKAAQKMRDKKLTDAGHNPATYQEPEGESENSPADSDNSEGGNSPADSGNAE